MQGVCTELFPFLLPLQVQLPTAGGAQVWDEWGSVWPDLVGGHTAHSRRLELSDLFRSLAT